MHLWAPNLEILLQCRGRTKYHYRPCISIQTGLTSELSKVSFMLLWYWWKFHSPTCQPYPPFRFWKMTQQKVEVMSPFYSASYPHNEKNNKKKADHKLFLQSKSVKWCKKVACDIKIKKLLCIYCNVHT